MSDYTPREMMALAAAREIRNSDIVFCGTGIALLAAMAAQRISAPHSTIFFETGAIDSQLAEMPLAVADPRVMHGTALNGSLADAFACMQNKFTGQRVVGILGAAQIDPHGNLNSTAIGNYQRPRIRFSGSGGACDVASFVGRTIIFMQHQKRKFVKQLDYRTSPGWLDGPEARPKAGLNTGGPSAVITDLGVMRFDPHTCRMVLDSCHPGIAPQTVLDNMSFEVDTRKAGITPPPSAQELRILREQCDPQGLILNDT